MLEPGAGIGNHPHPSHDELYLVVEGTGTGILDGERFASGSGDMYVLKAGQSHGIVNDSEQDRALHGPQSLMGRESLAGQPHDTNLKSLDSEAKAVSR